MPRCAWRVRAVDSLVVRRSATARPVRGRDLRIFCREGRRAWSPSPATLGHADERTDQKGGGYCVGVAEPDKTTADRLILISDIEHLRLERPVLVHAGERYWFDWEDAVQEPI